MAFSRRSFPGGAVGAHLQSAITSADLTFTLDIATGWTGGPYAVVFNKGGENEEKVLVSSLSGLTATVDPVGRGYDGTAAQSHQAGETVQPCITAIDLDEANYTVTETVGSVVAKGDLLVGDAPNSLRRVPVGSDTKLLVADSAQGAGLRWGNLPGGAINDPLQFSAAVIPGTALQSNSVQSSNIVDGTIATGDLAASAVTGAKIADATITPAKIAAGATLTIYAASAPSSPVAGQHWYDTTHLREFVWNGTIWQFLGGKAYVFQGENTGTHDLVDGQWNIEALTEIRDSDNAHSATDQFVTCPVTGWWACEVEGIFENDANDLHTIGLGFNVGGTYSTGTTAPTYSSDLAYTNDTSALTNNPRRHYAREVLVNSGDKVTPCWWSHIATGTGRILYASFQMRYVGSLT